MTSATLNANRIHAIKPEVINFMSFSSLVWELMTSPMKDLSFLTTLFMLLGIMILCLDAYFIYCQWMQKSSRAVTTFLPPNVRRFIPHSYSLNDLDDLLSDMPQAFWIVMYQFLFKNLKALGLVCAIHSAFGIAADALKMSEKRKQQLLDKVEEVATDLLLTPNTADNNTNPV